MKNGNVDALFSKYLTVAVGDYISPDFIIESVEQNDKINRVAYAFLYLTSNGLPIDFASHRILQAEIIHVIFIHKGA